MLGASCFDYQETIEKGNTVFLIQASCRWQAKISWGNARQFTNKNLHLVPTFDRKIQDQRQISMGKFPVPSLEIIGMSVPEIPMNLESFDWGIGASSTNYLATRFGEIEEFLSLSIFFGCKTYKTTKPQQVQYQCKTTKRVQTWGI